jgi:hypothetical protein
MDRSDPAAIRPAGVLDLLELHTKGVIELSHGAGQHDVPPARVLVDNGKTVLVRELLDGLDIGRIRPELLVVLLMGQVTLGLVAGGDFPDPFLQCIMLVVAQDQGDFQPLRRIGFSDRTCAGQWLPLTTHYHSADFLA